MLCSYCDGKTRVIDTSSLSSFNRQYLSDTVSHIAHLDQDMRIRKRQCKSCKRISVSVEMNLSEINHFFRETQKLLGKEVIEEIAEKRQAYILDRNNRKRS
tara:strand:+ start:307 stop:609 length:303 start_codon:yes stop_codon:yes gene_type:complete